MSDLKKLNNSLIDDNMNLYDFLQTDLHILYHSKIESLHTQCELFIERASQSSGAVDLAQFSQGQFEQVLKKRIMGHLRLGYHLDHCISDFFDAGFEPINIRGFADKVTYYLTYLRQAGVAQFPIEMQYGFNQQFCTLSFSVSVSHFLKEYLYTAAQKQIDLTDPLSTLIAQARELGHIVEIIYIESSKKLVINGSWLKEKVNHNLMFAMHSISSAKILASKKTLGTTPVKIWTQETSDQLELKPLENNHLGHIATESHLTAEKLKEDLIDTFLASFSDVGLDDSGFNVVKNTVDEVGDDPFGVIIESPRTKDENAVLIFQSLKDNLKNIDEYKLQKMVNETLGNYIQKHKHELKDQLAKYGNGEFGHMHETIKQKDSEIENLKNKVKTLYHELKAIQNTAQIKANLDKEVQVDIDVDQGKIDELEEEIVKREKVIENLMTKETLSRESREQITELLVKQGEISKEKYQVEMQLKKMEIIARQKESILLQQMQVKEKQISGKETMLLKMKDSLTRLSEVKDKAIKGLNDKLSQLNSELSDLKVKANSGKLDSLKRENETLNQNLSKMRDQLEQVNNQYQLLKNETSSQVSESEFNKLKSAQNKLETILTDKEQEISSLLKKLNENKSELEQKISENNKLELDLRNLQEAKEMTVEKPESDPITNTKINQALTQELMDVKDLLEEKDDIINALEMKLLQFEKDKAQVLSNTSSGPSEAEFKQLSLKLDKLEKDKVKMMDDVRTKTKESSEAIVASKKLKAEVTALQNRLKLIEQENQKLKAKNAAGQTAKKAS